MTDLAAEFAKVPEGDQLPFMAGVTVAYKQVFDALATAFETIRTQANEAWALVAVEGVMDE